MSGNEWLAPKARIVVTRDRPGHYRAGQRGRLVRPDGNGEWLVKMDDRMSGTTVRVADMRQDRE